MAKSINVAIILGNLTRAPELRYTPAGHAVCSFGVATNRVWKTAEGERREDAEFHNIVAWNRLAEICSQYLTKGQKVYIQGRLQTRTWEGQDGGRRSKTEIVADDMVMLQRPGGAPPAGEPEDYNHRAGAGARRAPMPTPVAEVDAADLPAGKVGEVKKEIKEEIKREAVEDLSPDQQKPAAKGKEDVDPEEVKKKMPF